MMYKTIHKTALSLPLTLCILFALMLLMTLPARADAVSDAGTLCAALNGIASDCAEVDGTNTTQVNITGTVTISNMITVLAGVMLNVAAGGAVTVNNGNSNGIYVDIGGIMTVSNSTVTVNNSGDTRTYVGGTLKIDAFQASSDVVLTLSGNSALIAGMGIISGINGFTAKAKIKVDIAQTLSPFTSVVTYVWDENAGSPSVGGWKALSSDATLSALTISAGTLSPAFAPATTSYAVSVDNSVSAVTVTPTVNDTKATAIVNGSTALNVGSNTITNGTTRRISKLAKID